MTDADAAREATRKAVAEVGAAMARMPAHYFAMVGPYLAPLWAAILAVNAELEARANDE